MDTDLSKSEKAWIKLMKIGSLTGCHQLNSRSFFIKGYQLPVCARCTGIFFGQLISYIFAVLTINVNIATHLATSIVSIILLGVDGLGQLKEKWESTNLRRLFTGLLCGFFITSLMIKLAHTLYIKIKSK